MKLSREFAHSAFERRALRSPGATAMAGGDARAACGALDAGTNRLAHHLRALGIGPGAPVAIRMLRSPAMIESVLAVSKAGGAFVPLAPACPPDRLASMPADARPAFVSADAACCPPLDPQQTPITERQDRTRGAAGAVRQYIAPSTLLEPALVQSWPELPGVEKITARDDFSALGGCSILGLRPLSTMRDTSGVDMSLREPFDGPTIEKMLEAICAKVEEAAMENA